MKLTGQFPPFSIWCGGESCTVDLCVCAALGGVGGGNHPACFEGGVDEEIMDLLEVGFGHDGQWGN